jgi:polyisoprenoid-binding protein YceI
MSYSLYAAPETWTLDPTHSYVLWKIGHLGFSTQAGKFYVTGTVILDDAHPENSRVDARVNIADIVTGLPELDKHLKSKLFFDADQFPTASFVSQQVKITSKTSATVKGMLTIHGVSKPVTLKVVMNKVGKNTITDKLTAGFSATTTIKRSDFGINAFLPDVADEVKIDIGAEANKA